MYKSLFYLYTGDNTYFLYSVLVNHQVRRKLPWLHNVLPRLSAAVKSGDGCAFEFLPLFVILVLIRGWRLSAARGLACHINMSISVARSCPWRQDISDGRSNKLWLTATVSLIRVVPTVIDPVAETTVGYTSLVVAGPETFSAAPVDCKQWN